MKGRHRNVNGWYEYRDKIAKETYYPHHTGVKRTRIIIFGCLEAFNKQHRGSQNKRCAIHYDCDAAFKQTARHHVGLFAVSNGGKR
ncbi:hypothetical protein SDC9_207738 [bioreactor metagenome]|uniref:Uncharacterized protein n=1 Tax=bioreactor metagenome TaxID=1076179 RepID=A0A645J8I4_9ZZZZ